MFSRKWHYFLDFLDYDLNVSQIRLEEKPLILILIQNIQTDRSEREWDPKDIQSICH